MRFYGKFSLILWIFAIFTFFAGSAFAEPINIRAVDADVKTLLFTVAKAGNINLVLDGEVSGKVTTNINNLEPIDALYMIASARGFAVEEKNNSVIVTSINNAAALRQMYTFTAKHAELSTIESALNLALKKNNSTNAAKSAQTSNRQNSVSNRAENESRVMISPTNNAIILYGTPKEAEMAKTLIASLDAPPKQISLMAKVVSVQKDASKNLGVEWRWSALPQYPNSRLTYEYEYDEETGVRRRTTTREFEREFEGSSNIPGIIRFGKGPEGYPYEFYYESKINALITDGKAKILSQPNITTLQGKEAVINIGGSVPVPTVSTTNSTVTTSVQYKEAGIILRYTPKASDDGYITAKVHTEVSSPVYVESLKAYRFQERSADTTVRLKNNETMVIGGLIGEEESKSLSKVPFLGDLPILGAFFRNNKNSKTESELMIFLTASVLED
ncbi:MAG: pilus assembly protein PilQ [Selenomonadaceae bacterium]|nr:pilus assembly protein PilQ [Selenomonadaceae bacterium]